MPGLARATVIGLAVLAGGAATADAQYYNYYSTQNPYTYSPYNYPGYQGSVAAAPYDYSYPGYGYAYNYPTYSYYNGSPYPAPRAYWDPYVGWRPYSDNAGPKASGHGG